MLPRPSDGPFTIPDEITCQELVELVTAYLEDDLDVDTRRRFDAHLLECDDCPAYVEQIRLTMVAVGAVTADDIAPETCTTLLIHFRAWAAQR